MSSHLLILAGILVGLIGPSFGSSGRSPSPSFTNTLEAFSDKQYDDKLYDRGYAESNVTSIDYSRLYDPYLSSASSLSTHSLDSLKYQFQKVARTGRLFTPQEGASAEFAFEWKINLVTIDFQKLIFGSRRSDEYQGRTFGTAGTSQGATEGESTSEIVVFNQSALLIVGIVVIAALLIFPAFGQNLGLTRSDRHEDHNGAGQLDILEKLDEYLQMFGVDGNACMNLMICSAVEKLKKTSRQGTGNPFEQVVQGFMEIDHVREFLAGSKFNEAIRIARNGEDCDAEYADCPFSIGMAEKMFGGWLDNAFSQNEANL